MVETLCVPVGARDHLRVEAEAGARLPALLAQHVRPGERVLVVCSTQRSCADTVRACAGSAPETCGRPPIIAVCSHGAMGWGEREQSEAAFARRDAQVLAIVGTSLTARPAARLRADVVVVKGAARYAGRSAFVPYSAAERRVFASHALRLCVEVVPGKVKLDGDGRAAESSRGTRQKGGQPIAGACTHAEILGAAARVCGFAFRPVPDEIWAQARSSPAIRLRPHCQTETERIVVGCQLALADAFDPQWPRSFVVDCGRAAAAAARALAKIQGALPRKSGAALRNCIELAGALRGRAWHDDAARVLSQLDGVGSSYAQRLVAAGLATPADIVAAGAGRVQALLGRAPPFGQTVVSSAMAMPTLGIEAEIGSGGTGRTLLVRWDVSPGADAHVLVVGDDRALLARRVCSPGCADVRVPLRLSSVVVSAMSESHAGVNVHRVVETAGGASRVRLPNADAHCRRPTLRQTTIGESLPKRPRANPDSSETGNAAGCAHRCADRHACGHACCKAVPTPRGSHRALVAWLSQFRCGAQRSATEPARALRDYLGSCVGPETMG